MKKWGLIACVAVCLSACAGGAGGILPDGAVEIKENRVGGFTSSNGARYAMRTYTAPSDGFYYITVTPAGRSLSFENNGRSAGSAAAAYIRQRGCTDNLSRLSSRDVYDPSSTTWTIVISC